MKQELSAQTGFSMVSIFYMSAKCMAMGTASDISFIMNTCAHIFLSLNPQPERYYHVSREEGQDGRFYSKISAVDWDDL
jgi:hypothetical protein